MSTTNHEITVFATRNIDRAVDGVVVCGCGWASGFVREQMDYSLFRAAGHLITVSGNTNEKYRIRALDDGTVDPETQELRMIDIVAFKRYGYGPRGVPGLFVSPRKGVSRSSEWVVFPIKSIYASALDIGDGRIGLTLSDITILVRNARDVVWQPTEEVIIDEEEAS